MAGDASCVEYRGRVEQSGEAGPVLGRTIQKLNETMPIRRTQDELCLVREHSHSGPNSRASHKTADANVLRPCRGSDESPMGGSYPNRESRVLDAVHATSVAGHGR